MQAAAASPRTFRAVVRIAAAPNRVAEVASRLRSLRDAGATDVVVDVDWEDDDGEARASEALRSAVA